MAVFDFQKTEQKILEFWHDHRIFQKSLDQRRTGRKKNFVFFEGPPTANGLPHIGHFLTRIHKDLYGRYKTMRGYFVLRKAGWDTHGLPVEIEVEKQLGFTNKKQIEEYGIAAFNRKARESVWKYQREWEEMTERMGFWVDMSDPYITYESSYIESLWSIMRQVWDKKLLYKAHRVVPFCTRCGTALSSHEVAQGYKTVTDTSVYVKFKVTTEGKFKNAYILAWTTTPWTLPGNVALAVGKEIEYKALTADFGHGLETLIFSDTDPIKRILAGQYDRIESSESLTGEDLVGLEYEPLFNVPVLQSEKSYHVYKADFVSTTEGTGIVHTAVMYGEDDYILGTQLGLPKVHTVDKSGKFTGAGEELEGKYVKDPKTEELILEHLKKNGLLLKTEQHEHEYPFCWRCDTPLLYYAKDSWFIRMSALRDQLLKNNDTVNWVPAHIKEGRFGQWLREGKDWAFSRERYWGTPLPIWECTQCHSTDLIGSYAHLREQAVTRGNTYFVMRHGFTNRDEREKEIINTRLENDVYPLTDEGRQQVEKIAAEFKKRHDHFDLIYASPLKRTKETAEIAGRIFHTEVVTDERLIEVRHDRTCEDKPHTECPMANQKKSFTAKDADGESWDDVRIRMTAFMQELEREHKGKKILIVSHGHPVWLLDKIARGWSAKEILARQDTDIDWYPPVAGVKELDWQTIPRNEYGELDPHRPFIDDFVLRCVSCGADMRRIPDLIDVWFDSGAMPYAQWHVPFENEKTFKEQFPADFIVEAIDQTRGWFYTLLAIATLLDKGAPYRNVMVLGHTLDEKGQKMSKSKGNVIPPKTLMDAVGVDATRWRLYTMNAPGDPKPIALRDFQDTLKGFIASLANCMRFYELYRKEVASDAGQATNALDKWILSRLHGTIASATESMDTYDPATASRAVERFVTDDFSNWWLRRSRKRPEALPLLRVLLMEIAKLCAPFIPFTAEDMFLRLRGATDAESVHLTDWPTVSKRAISAKLEEEMVCVQEAVRAGLGLRKELQIRVRQPLQSVTVTGKKFDADLETLIKDELNVKEIRYQKAGDVVLDVVLTPELIAEGLAREMVRQVQDMRKEAGYAFDAKIYCQWQSGNEEVTDAINHWSKDIEHQAVLSNIVNVAYDSKHFDVQKETELMPGKKIWIGLRK